MGFRIQGEGLGVEGLGVLTTIVAAACIPTSTSALRFADFHHGRLSIHLRI